MRKEETKVSAAAEDKLKYCEYDGPIVTIDDGDTIEDVLNKVDLIEKIENK